MAKKYKYSLAPEDRKIAGVAATIAEKSGIDATLVRIAFILSFLFVEWEPTVIAYVGLALFFSWQLKQGDGGKRGSDEDDWRGAERKPFSGSVHDARTKLDRRDRKMMAIDRDLVRVDNEQLDREIAELRAKIAADRGAEGDAGKEKNDG